MIAAYLGRPITIFGDGKQIRDLLHISDLVRAYAMAIDRIDEISGQAINLGGGPDNTITIWSEFGPLLESLLGKPIEVSWDDWRPGDQRVFIANIQQAWQRLGWRPQVSPTEGIRDLYKWVSANPDLFE